MFETCKVVKIKKGVPYIKVVMNENCASCNACAFGAKKTLSLPAFSEVEVKVGDSVGVQMPKKQITAAFVYAYLLPLAFLIIGFFIGGIFGGDIWRFALSCTFCALSFIAVYIIDKHIRKNKNYLPIIKSVVDNNDTLIDTKAN